jgi:general secretion pathway protein K
MPDPPGEDDKEVPLSEQKNKKYRFNGQILDLAYPVPKNVSVRIYDLAGKINIRLIPQPKMRQLLEKRVGKDLEKLSALEDTWMDWIDQDDLKRMNGAEKDYYETLTPPYKPRNSALETVEELLLIKGFAEVFEGLELDTIFTVYGNIFGTNPNLATQEVLMILPGTDADIVKKILVKRRDSEFKSLDDLKRFIQPEPFAEMRSWFHFSNENFYTIAIQVDETTGAEEENTEANDEQDTDANEEVTSTSDELETAGVTTEESAEPINEIVPLKPEEYQRAYLVTVQPRGYNTLPKVLMVNPYGILPDSRHEQMTIEDDEDSGGLTDFTTDSPSTAEPLPSGDTPSLPTSPGPSSSPFFTPR